MYNKNRKIDQIKWIATFVAIILLTCACVTSIVMGVKNNGWFKKEEVEQTQPDRQPEQALNEDSGMLLNCDGSAQFMSLRSAEVTPLSNTVESSATLTATVLPLDAANKAVAYSVAWKNISSSWATGKTVTDYVDVVQESVGSLTATVNCYKPFGEQVIIKCVSDVMPSVYAECTADYVKRIVSCDWTFSPETPNTLPNQACFSFETDYTYDRNSMVLTYTAGTITPTKTYSSIRFCIPEETLSYAGTKSGGFSASLATGPDGRGLPYAKNFAQTTTFRFNFEDVFLPVNGGVFTPEDFYGIFGGNYFINTVPSTHKCALAFDINCYATTTPSGSPLYTYTVTKEVPFDWTYGKPPVTEVNLDKTKIQF